ncbi:hypothetical protein J2X68_006377 [Streptomyces sp. 3330]|nr:hypothetical protein [Streptomyces sp. 3330]
MEELPQPVPEGKHLSDRHGGERPATGLPSCDRVRADPGEVCGFLLGVAELFPATRRT